MRSRMVLVAGSLLVNAMLVGLERPESVAVALVAVLGGLALLGVRVPGLDTWLGWLGIGLGLGGVFVARVLTTEGDVPVPAGYRLLPHTLCVIAGECLLLLQGIWVAAWSPVRAIPIRQPIIGWCVVVLTMDRAYLFRDQVLYVFLTTVAVLLPALMRVGRAGERAEEVRESRGVGAVLLSGSLMVLMGTWLLTDVWSTSLPELQSWFANAVGSRVQRASVVRRYVSLGTLHAVREEIDFEPLGTALRVFSEHQPGYLASRKFDHYEDGAWTLASDQRLRRRVGDGLMGLRLRTPLPGAPEGFPAASELYPYFAVRGQVEAPRWQSMTIENDPRRGPSFFMPLGYQYLQMAADEVLFDEYDMLRAGGKSVRPYRVWLPESRPREQIPAEQLGALLERPVGLPADIDELVDEVVGGSRNDATRIAAVQTFFQQNFEYRLERTPSSLGEDPLVYFLRTRHPAHCEYFASGAVTLLRLSGVPARYCVGYRVVTLDDKDGEYWVARNRNAHAWAEAFDRQRGEWVVVEATPGFRVAESADGLARDQQRRGLDQGLGANVVGSFTDRLIDLLNTVWLRVVVVLVAVGGLGLVLRRHGWKGRGGDGDSLRLKAMRRELRRFESSLRRRGLVRGEGETLSRFARRIRDEAGESLGGDSWAERAADWLEVYVSRRYTLELGQAGGDLGRESAGGLTAMGGSVPRGSGLPSRPRLG